MFKWKSINWKCVHSENFKFIFVKERKWKKKKEKEKKIFLSYIKLK